MNFKKIVIVSIIFILIFTNYSVMANENYKLIMGKREELRKHIFYKITILNKNNKIIDIFTIDNWQGVYLKDNYLLVFEKNKTNCSYYKGNFYCYDNDKKKVIDQDIIFSYINEKNVYGKSLMIEVGKSFFKEFLTENNNSIKNLENSDDILKIIETAKSKQKYTNYQIFFAKCNSDNTWALVSCHFIEKKFNNIRQWNDLWFVFKKTNHKWENVYSYGFMGRKTPDINNYMNDISDIGSKDAQEIGLLDLIYYLNTRNQKSIFFIKYYKKINDKENQYQN